MRDSFVVTISALLVFVFNSPGQQTEHSSGMKANMQEMISNQNKSTDSTESAGKLDRNKVGGKQKKDSNDSRIKQDFSLKSQINCPVMGSVIDKKLFVDYNNQRIFVCCEKCIDIVKKQPENALLQLRNYGQQAERRKKTDQSTEGLVTGNVRIDNQSRRDTIILSGHNANSSMDMVMDSSTKSVKPSVKNETEPGRWTGVPKTVVYRLNINDTVVNYTGKNQKALAINGSIPGPTLTFTEGDTAEIYVHNDLTTESSIHWHGLIVPNRYDGVPYLTTAPIEPGKTQLFKFKIVQNGTYWYHSHTKLQEQQGLYGAIVIHKREDKITNEHVILLSDWTDEKPEDIHRGLIMGNDWYSIKRGSTQSFAEAVEAGHFWTKFVNTFKRMSLMDVSDVYYERALINGKPKLQINNINAGEKIKLRIINGAASTYFWINFSGGPMTVVANDGIDVEPVVVDRFIIGVSETYDIIVTVPDSKSYELMATSEDRTISASVWLGNGLKVSLKPLPPLKYFEGMKVMNKMMGLNGKMNDKGMKSSLQTMDMSSVMYSELGENAESGPNYPVSNQTPHNGNKTSDTTANSPPSTPYTGQTEVNRNEIIDTSMSDMNDAHGMSSAQMVMSTVNHQNESPHNTAEPVQIMDSVSGGSHTGRMDDKNEMKGHGSMNSGIRTLDYTMLKSKVKTTLPAGPLRIIKFNLSGNMNRYVWTMNNKKVSERNKILIKKGENVRIILHNGTMMRHPMHLHGHFFRVLNGHGDYSPLKTVLDILPMETDTIEFAATEYGDWFFHCHILYHMMSGMGAIFSYEDSPPNPEFTDQNRAYRTLLREDKSIHSMAILGLESNRTRGEIAFSTTRFLLQGDWRITYKSDVQIETETRFGRYFGEKQWWFPYLGTDWRYSSGGREETNLFRQKYLKDKKVRGCAGIQYVAPFLILADLRVDHKGIFRLQLSQEELPVTSRLRLNWYANTDKEYSVGVNYRLAKHLSLSMHYDNDAKWGGGISLRY